jgi:hypothetical protein
MAKVIYSNQVCGLLAQQLVEEQAEVVKHEAVVKELKNAIISRKVEVVSNLVEGRVFDFDNKQVIVLDIDSYEVDDGFYIELIFGELPTSATLGFQLTKRESELLSKYTYAIDRCSRNFDRNWYIRANDVANELANLKNGIKLIERSLYGFNFDDAIDPDFFKKTGITVERFCGCSYKKMSLEETSRKIG